MFCTTDDNTPVEDTNADSGDVDTSLPCSFTLDTVQAGDTVIIDCIMDLGGQTINLPANVTLVYEGGDIVNGTLNFSDNSIISGELLNSSLTLGGSTPQMKDTVFQFDPQRWGIIEGIVSDDVANTNRFILKSLLNDIKKFGVNTFKIDNIDAYFKVDEPSGNPTPTQFAITIPSDFNLIMTQNTHLRIQPNAYKQPTLLSILDVSNVTIDGGVLHGDRDEHDYSDGGTHEWETLISIKAGINITVKNVTMMDATGDGIGVSNLNHAYEASYKPSVNVNISNNIFLRNRRNQLSIVDGREVIVENNQFIDASIHTDKSLGTAPGFAIDVEAVRGSNPAGPQQIAQDIIIRNNTEIGSRGGGFTVHTGDRVTFEGNNMDNGISYSTATEIIIRNNNFNALNEQAQNYGTAIVAGRFDLYERNFGSRVYGNFINGYSKGITISNTELEVYDNDINECKTGLSIESITNSKVFNNKIYSRKNDSDGILNSGQSDYFDGLLIEKNTIDVIRTPFLIVGINKDVGEENYNYTINDNTIINEGATFSDTHGFTFSNNKINNGGMRIVNAVNGNILGNTIVTTNRNGIRIDEGCKDVNILANDIDVSDNFSCIKLNSNDGVNIVINNTNCH